MSDAEPNRVEILADEPPRGPPRRSPPNYLASATRWRLLLLTASLFLVLVLMREAGNPDNWAWMGFDHSPPGVELRSIDEVPPDPRPALADDGESARDGFPPDGSSPRDIAALDDTSPLPREFVTYRRDVWHEIFSKLTADQRRQWFSLIYVGRGRSSTLREKSAQWLTIQAEIEQLLHRRLTADWEQFAGSGRLSPEQIDTFSDWTVTLRDQWSESLSPALAQSASGAALDAPQREGLDVLARDLASPAWSLVADQTAAARPVEGPAWLVAWEQALDLPTDSSLMAPTVYELLSQPAGFRARGVRIAGTLQLVEQLDVPTNDLGIDRYYVLWIKPRERSQTPLCIYIRDWPQELPPLEQRYGRYDQPVSAAAVFFKVRSYLADDDRLAMCPLLFARTVALESAHVRAASGGQSLMDRRSTWLLMGLLPILAAWIAWRVYRSTRWSSRPRSAFREHSTTANLKRLERDSRIKSPREHVADFEKSQQE